MKNGLVTIIMSVYNRPEYISDALSSIFAQSCKEFEVIVVDDGSTEDMKVILGEYLPRVRYFRKENGGAASARNYGIERAEGEYISFLDSDDMWHQNKLDMQLKFLKGNKEIGLVCSGFLYHGRNGKKTGDKAEWEKGNLFESLFCKSFIHTSTVVLRRSVLDKVGLFDEQYMCAEDYDLWLRIAKANAIGRYRAPLATVREHDLHLSSNKVALRTAAYEILSKHYDPNSIPLHAYYKRMSDLEIYFGRAFIRLDDYEKAIFYFKRSVKRTPFRIRSWRYLLRCYVGSFLRGSKVVKV